MGPIEALLSGDTLTHSSGLGFGLEAETSFQFV